MNTYKDPEYRGYYLGKVAAALIVLLIIVIAVAAVQNQGVTTTPAAAPATPAVESAELSPEGVVTVSGVSEPGSTVDLYAGDVRLGSVVAGADGRWSYQGPLDPGDYQFVARTLNKTGQIVSESAVMAVSLGEATTSPVAKASGTSAIATGAPEAAQAATTGAATAAGTAAAPVAESPEPIAAATVALAGGATAVPAAGELPTTAAGTAQAPAAGELTTAAPGVAQAPAAGQIATAVPAAGELPTTAPGAAQAPAAGELATAAPAAAQPAARVALPTTVVSAEAAAGTAPASPGLAVDRAMVDETGQVTLIGTGRPNAPIEIIQDGEVIGTIVVKGDGTWSYTYVATPGVQVMAVQYKGQPDSRSAPSSFQIEGTSSVAGAPTPSEAAAPASKPAAAATSVKPQETGAGRAYIVREGDYLTKLARRFYGSGAEWPTIYNGTNKMAKKDDSFAEIEDPDVIIPGWKLWIPAQ